VPKSELLDPTSSDAAVKQAHAETHVIQETKAYFTDNGVDLAAFKQKARGDTAVLVKNFSFDTKATDLKNLFETYGPVSRLLMPPSGTIAIVEFNHADDARSAFAGLAYRKVKDSILFLEKAPRDIFGGARLPGDDGTTTRPSSADNLEVAKFQDPVQSSTLFVSNLNFATTTERLRELFEPLDGFLSAKVKHKPDPKKAGQFLSMGFGFVEFRTKEQAQAALTALDNHSLDGHKLLIRSSHKGIDAAEERKKADTAKKLAGKKTKIIIKNLPFEASRKDVRSLLGPYGQLRSVRVPKKFDTSTRGFAFAEFVSAKEAENALNALKDTHLLGRRLVLEFAAEDAVDPEVEIAKMQKKVGKQADKVALQRLTGTGRKKFNIELEDG
jgi:multiple RNA-binding domain-containing protein 1